MRHFFFAGGLTAGVAVPASRLLGAPFAGLPVESWPWEGPSAAGGKVTQMLQVLTVATRGMLAGQLFVWLNHPVIPIET